MHLPKVLHRDLALDVRAATEDGIPAVLSTTAAVDRCGYREVLAHDADAVDLSRAPLPLIESHDSRRVNVGIVDNIRVDGDKLRGVARFGTSARARELVADIKAGIVRSLSVGYEILKFRESGGTVTATRWRPFETSIVAVPADPGAGFFRGKDMTDVIEGGRDLNRGEADRIKTIYQTGAQFGQQELAQRAVDGNWSRERFQAAVLERMGAKEITTTPDLGLEEHEKRAFSFARLARYLANPTDRKLRSAAGFELEVCQPSDKGDGVRIPHEVLTYGQRSLAKGSTNSGAKLVATELLEGSFIDMLRAALVVRQAGATFIDGLQGDVAIPRQTAGSNFYFVDEADDVGEGQPAYDQVPLTPHTVGSHVDMTRRLLLQSTPGVEQLVRRDFSEGIARAIDAAALFGNPSFTSQVNRPRGVAYTAGIGSVSGGTNGAPPMRAHLVSLKAEVAIDNAATGRLAFITNSKVLGKLENTLLDAGSGKFTYEGDGVLVGRPVYESNAVPSNLTKGGGSNLSGILYGDWSQLIIGTWSGVDVLSDPYSLGKSGGLRLIVLHDFDVAVRHPESFSVMLDAITAP